jgi:hypothetical protein
MMHTIRVDRVLRETVNTPYSDLVTRASGAAVRTSLHQAIAALPGGTAVLDFSAVGLVDFSCADEVVAKLLLELSENVAVILGGLREDHSEAIGHVLTGHDLVVVTQETPGSLPRLLGHVDQDTEDAFESLSRYGPAEPATLAARLGWEVARARISLEALVRLRLAQRDGAAFTSHPIP